jgi:flagellar biosynthesis component FlhA
MKHLITYLTPTKPLFGISIITGNTILFWLGILTPLVAFAGVIFGSIAAIYSWRVNKIKKEREEIELEISKNHLKRMIEGRE